MAKVETCWHTTRIDAILLGLTLPDTVRCKELSQVSLVKLDAGHASL